MELDKKILESVLKGINELEGNPKGSFEIENLNNKEAIHLISTYVSNYAWDSKKENNTYTLIVTKHRMNQQR